MHSAWAKLLGNFHTTVAKNAACHVKFDLISDIYFFKFPALEFIAGFHFSVLVAQVLQITFSSLVAYRAVEWMIDQKKFYHTGSCFYYRSEERRVGKECRSRW